MKLIHKVILFGLGVYAGRKAYDWWYGYKKPTMTPEDYLQDIVEKYKRPQDETAEDIVERVSENIVEDTGVWEEGSGNQCKEIGLYNNHMGDASVCDGQHRLLAIMKLKETETEAEMGMAKEAPYKIG